MAFNGGFFLAVLVAMVAAAQLVGNASAATYVVGDSLGWTVPPNGPASYSTWASQHVFRTGDVLVFNFTTGFHDVAYVNQSAFNGCSSSSPITLLTVGPANFALNATGAHYFICTFGQHCSLGQRLAINVTAASTSPAPAPSPTPTPAPAPARPPSTSPAPVPAPAPSAPTTPTPSPSPVPTPSGSPSAAPSPAGGPSALPSPTPGSGVPPLSPASQSAPGGELTPPPPPSSATLAKMSAPFVVFMSIAFGLMI